jgi:hypothetical protein
VQGENRIVAVRGGDRHVLEIHSLPRTAVPYPGLFARAFHEDAPHCFRRGAEEMAASVPALLPRVHHQSQPGFMHERGGLERLARLFSGHLRGRELAQFVIHQRQQLIAGFGIAFSDQTQDARNFIHSCGSKAVRWRREWIASWRRSLLPAPFSTFFTNLETPTKPIMCLEKISIQVQSLVE